MADERDDAEALIDNFENAVLALNESPSTTYISRLKRDYAAAKEALRARLAEADELRAKLHSVRSALASKCTETDVVAARAEAAEAENARLREALLDGGRELPTTRDDLGRKVREAWVRWALTQPNPKPSWLVPYDELSEPDKEADRQIGEAIARWTLILDAARMALKGAPDAG